MPGPLQSDSANAIPVWIGAPGGGAGRSLGFQSITGLNTAKTLTVPVGAKTAVVSPSTQGVRWRDDGVAPTAAVGLPIAANASQTFYGDALAVLQFIEQTASATLNVAYYA